MNKGILSLAVLALFLSLFAEKTNAQASGTNPQLYMYRHNGSLGNTPSAVLPTNTLGNLEWRGLTATNAIRLGATIKSNVVNVSPGNLAANMIFSTSNMGIGLKERMIITESGLVGIGTLNPVYHLDVVGNTHTSGRFFGRIHFDVDEPTDLPNTYIDEAYFERKSRAQLGLAANTYSNGGILSLAPGGGSLDRQLFTGGDDGLWTRSQDLGAANAWAAWEKILTSGDINGRPNLTARFMPPGPTSSKLSDGQIFDNGTNVVIGGIPASPAVPAPTFNANDELTVQGDARVADNLAVEDDASVGGNANIAGNASVTGSTTSGSLSVTNNATVGGSTSTNALSVTMNANVGANTTTNSLNVTTDATVNGASRLVGKVAIGAGSVPTGGSPDHALYVGGSIIAEEVVVKLKANWPDYVFAPTYAVQPLAEVEAFIQQEKHLPGVPSAAEVAENGISLGEMQKTQMEKIEELYLHMIQQQKQIEQQQKTIERLESEIKNLQK